MKVQMPIVGHAAGRTAGLIYQTYNGHTYARSLPVIYHYPDTPLQQDCQAKFYNIQEQWLPIYNSFKRLIPRNQRHNTNMFNVLSAGVYLAAQTYANSNSKGRPQHFGSDIQQQIQIKTIKAGISIDPKLVVIDADVVFVSWRRTFVPRACSLLLVNASQQLLMFTRFDYSESDFRIEFSNMQSWLQGDSISAYLALASKDFFTDFYLLAL